MILLDTCTLLWLALDPSKLSPSAHARLADPAERVWVSAITAFELGQKHAKGSLELNLPPAEWFSRALVSHRLHALALEAPVALRAAALPPLHNDPFDRLLIATAQAHKLTLLTPDPKIHAYPEVKVLW
jgi:PIN domain nuclease of toxin-antitoxin system